MKFKNKDLAMAKRFKKEIRDIFKGGFISSCVLSAILFTLSKIYFPEDSDLTLVIGSVWLLMGGLTLLAYDVIKRQKQYVFFAQTEDEKFSTETATLFNLCQRHQDDSWATTFLSFDKTVEANANNFDVAILHNRQHLLVKDGQKTLTIKGTLFTIELVGIKSTERKFKDLNEQEKLLVVKMIEKAHYHLKTKKEAETKTLTSQNKIEEEQKYLDLLKEEIQNLEPSPEITHLNFKQTLKQKEKQA